MYPFALDAIRMEIAKTENIYLLSNFIVIAIRSG